MHYILRGTGGYQLVTPAGTLPQRHLFGEDFVLLVAPLSDLDVMDLLPFGDFSSVDLVVASNDSCKNTRRTWSLGVPVPRLDRGMSCGH